MKTALLAVAAAVVFVALIYPSRTHRESRWPNGNLKAAWSEDGNGVPHGISRNFREDGTLDTETRFVHGVWTESRDFYRSGQIQSERTVTSDGDRVRMWNEGGELIRDVIVTRE